MARMPEDDSSSPVVINNVDATAPLRMPKTLGELFGARGGPLLILRAFLGVTFLYAGLQKLANPDFFRSNAPGSFLEQVRGAITTSPLHHLLNPALHAPTLIALIISFAEVAVGLGTLLGIFSRLASIGGMLLALTFFLVVSYNDNPYYYGPDIVFLFAWTPLVIARPGTWTLDEVYARRIARIREQRSVPKGRGRGSTPDEVERRVVLQRGLTAGTIGVLGLATGGIAAAIGRAFHGHTVSATPVAPTLSSSPPPSSTSPTSSSPSSSTPTSSSPSSSTPTSSSPPQTGPTGKKIGPSASVPIGGAASFTDPITSVPALVVQPDQGGFAAFSAVCPHAGCIVGFDGQQKLFVCPCHGSMFNGRTGSVVQGPATLGLTPISVKLDKNGDLYVTD